MLRADHTRLNSAGLDTHEVEEASNLTESCGGYGSVGLVGVTPPPATKWRVDAVLKLCVEGRQAHWKRA